MAGEEERERRARLEGGEPASFADIFLSVWNILKAALLFEIARAPATMGHRLGPSLGQICIQKTSC